MVYATVQCYSTDNSNNPKVNEEYEQIYVEIHMADWWWITKQALINSGAQKAIVILVLLAIDKTVFTEHIKDMMQ